MTVTVPYSMAIKMTDSSFWMVAIGTVCVFVATGSCKCKVNKINPGPADSGYTLSLQTA